MPTDDPNDLTDEIWNQIAEFDDDDPKSLFDVLSESGVLLPPPEELGDAELTGKLWEVIHALARLGAFLHNTNHLSDRQLYVELWGDALREQAILAPENPACSWNIDLVGSGSEEHTRLHLKYYADEESRRSWLEDWPSDPLPEHEDPPHDRDRHLPKAESRLGGPLM